MITPENSGRGGMVDTTVLEAVAKSVGVRVSSPAPCIRYKKDFEDYDKK